MSFSRVTKQHEALRIISSSYVNSNMSQESETAIWGLTSVTMTFDF